MPAHTLAASYRAWLAAGAQRVGPDPHELRDAAWECPAHGRLPHDAWRDPACDCWGPSARKRPTSITTQEAMSLMDTTATPKRAAKKRAARKAAPKRAATVSKPDAAALTGPNDLIARQIGELNAEIAKLTAARDALAAL